jgi:hypothetical protein
MNPGAFLLLMALPLAWAWGILPANHGRRQENNSHRYGRVLCIHRTT